MPAEEVIVLVGGLGTRLRQVVPDLPKPLAPVAGRPFLAWLLDAYADAGLRRVILATGYRSRQIEQAMGTSWRGMEVIYSVEQAPLGTGGAIRQALARVQGDGVHLANGDTFLRYDPVSLETATRNQGCDLGIALAEVDDVARYGAIEVASGRVMGFREKGGHGPGLVNAGSYFLAADGFERLPSLDGAGWSFEECVLRPWSEAGKVAAFDETSDFIDIGVPEDYARAQRLFSPR
ncbi:sugar phosphate nucleotidyltransferase [Pseudoxanthomonas suwonensis]|uniref:sugar phosphate nucleotidyltransferase n=1 Tax=Pseudoxanthomonas suwonensis TaxID=314722 RepID=UPI00048DEED9|nr:sugar phosphate nucleotidyltransferase [Pseudoxanthomonas suwonensis]